MKKRILYILLGVMLAFQSNAAISFNWTFSFFSFTYNGTSFNYPIPQVGGATPGVPSTLDYYIKGINSTVFNTSLIANNIPISAGEYEVYVIFNQSGSSTQSEIKSFVINKATPTLTITNSPLIYTANSQSATLTSSVAGLPSNIKYNGSSMAPTNAGTYSITADFVPTDVVNYNSLTGANAGNFAINKAAVTISNIELTKIYDGTSTVNVISNSPSGIFSGDDIVIIGNATNFSNKIVANNYSSTVTFSLTTIPSTGKENNYYISGSNPIVITNGVITKLPITLTASANTKVYDGTVGATATPTITTGALVSGDVGTFIETYDTKSQGLNKVLTPAVVSILDATNTSMVGNYSITYQTNTSGVITKLPITLTASTNTKVYDGTISSTATPTLTGTLASGDIGVYSQTYDTKVQGTNKKLTPTTTILDATNVSMIGNYSITYASVNSGVIEKLPITLTASANTKVYDGTVSATATPTITTGALVSGDVGTYSETYDTKSQGINKILSPSVMSILDASNTSMAGNYSITYQTNTSGVITKLPITLTSSANTKVYDGTVSATAIPTITTGALVSGDFGTYSETYDTKSQGTNKVLTPTVVSILDASNTSMAGNYSITYQTNTSGVITAKQLTIADPTITKSKEYDKTVTVNTTAGTLLGVVTVGTVTDFVTASSIGTYSTSTVGTNKTITIEYTLAGADKDNYIKPLDKVYTDGVITTRSITIIAIPSDKEYDGNTTATVTLTDNRISGDELTVNKTSATFNNKNVGTGKAVTVSGISLTGTDAGNYTLTSTTATGTASITVKSLTITPTATDKVYDGNTTATATLTDNRITGDVFTVNKTSTTFNNKNIGVRKAVTVSGITLTGSDAGNYTLTSATAAGSASITVKSLTISATASDKIYDGNNNATINLVDNRVSGDILTVNKVGATFNDKNVGSGKTVNVSGINLTGIDAGNYSLINTTTTGTASITSRNLIITAIGKNKPYDGNRKAEVALTENKISGDNITTSYILAEFDTPEVGDNKLVTVSGISIGGVDVGNYNLTSNNVTTNASITAPATIIFEIPNAFTPNGDGMNDELKIISNAGVRSLTSFKIFSRSGNLVFESRDLSRGWDGRYNGNLLPADIYYWTAVYVDRNNVTNPKNGTVLLLK